MRVKVQFHLDANLSYVQAVGFPLTYGFGPPSANTPDHGVTVERDEGAGNNWLVTIEIVEPNGGELVSLGLMADALRA